MDAAWPAARLMAAGDQASMKVEIGDKLEELLGVPCDAVLAEYTLMLVTNGETVEAIRVALAEMVGEAIASALANWLATALARLLARAAPAADDVVEAKSSKPAASPVTKRQKTAPSTTAAVAAAPDAAADGAAVDGASSDAGPLNGADGDADETAKPDAPKGPKLGYSRSLADANAKGKGRSARGRGWSARGLGRRGGAHKTWVRPSMDETLSASRS
ncbi:hypothetical protein M885DRAFT_508000 [Pelagophyceae sp. CCMP2097]|nr:hypothetical protein M885DRAFT_508000 [Pelagophyceae sp. CCMP2097]|mmetsp:Transcript_30184/g.101758  ORF Transcript_30184/g.101758 Transcript_30184/m.101758 type:complete len:218 (+) Transcript_30184:55-708(+)